MKRAPDSGRGRRAGGAPEGWARRATLALSLLALALTTFAIRTLPARDVVFPAPGEVRLLANDSYYHLRHARFAAQHFPHVQRWDVASRYPTGERTDAAGLFDLVIAATALVASGGSPSTQTLERAAAVIPPLLGALVIPVLYVLARSVSGAAPALLACALFLLYPGYSLGRTLLGFADHHAAEMLLALLSAVGLVRCVRAARAPSAPPWWRPAWLHALGLVLLVFTWNGAPLLLVVTFGALLAFGAFEVAVGVDPRPTARAAFRFGAGASIPVALVALLWPDALLEEELRRELLVACALLALGPAALLGAAGLAAAHGVRRVLCGIAVLLLPVAGCAAAILSSGSAAELAAAALSAKSALVDEQRPVNLGSLFDSLGPVGLLALAALPVAGGVAWRRESARLAILPLAFGSLLIALWWQAHDYDYYVPPFSALMAAFVITEAARIASRHGTTRTRRGLALALAVVLIAPIWPLRAVRAPWHDRAEIMHTLELGDGWRQALHWLRTESPAPSLPVDARMGPWTGGDFAYPEGTYGVLSSWESGNLVAALGERPAAEARGYRSSSFAFYLAEDETSALRLLCPRCRRPEQVRYVIVDARSLGDYFLAKVRQSGGDVDRYRARWATGRTGGHDAALMTLGGAYRRTLAARLLLDDGNGLSHFRLVYDSPHESYLTTVAQPQEEGYAARRRAIPIGSAQERERYAEWAEHGEAVETPAGLFYDGVLASSVKIFEHVRGARLQGRVPPLAHVEARLELDSLASGRSVRYRSSTNADDKGRFELVVAHASEADNEGTALRARGPYRIHVTPSDGAAERVLEMAVSEADVERGSWLLVRSPR